MHEPPTTPPAAEQPPAAPPEQPAAASQEQVDQLLAEVQALRERVAKPVRPADAQGIPERPESLPDYAGEWPKQGGVDGPQPWDLRAQGLKVGTDDSGSTTVIDPHSGHVVELDAGGTDTISPIVPAHGRPPLSSGSAGSAVLELGALLADIGYPNSVSKGLNPYGIFDESIAGAVERFRYDFDVKEDPSQFTRDKDANAASHVLAYTWEAILRAAKRARDEHQVDGRQLDHPQPVAV